MKNKYHNKKTFKKESETKPATNFFTITPNRSDNHMPVITVPILAQPQTEENIRPKQYKSDTPQISIPPMVINLIDNSSEHNTITLSNGSLQRIAPPTAAKQPFHKTLDVPFSS